MSRFLWSIFRYLSIRYLTILIFRYLNFICLLLSKILLTMRLQRQKTREYGGRDYYRWTVVIPPEKIEALHWNEGLELEPDVKDDKLVIRKKGTKID